MRARDALASSLRVARFLRGRASFDARADDIFVASYPRSGTTWLQQIFCVLVNDGELEFEHVDDVAPWWERSLALGVRRAADFERLASPRVMKTHLPHAWLPRGARYVYVTRDGRDVAVSYYHLYRSHLGYQGSFDDFFDRFVDGHLQYGSWFKHVQGWAAARGEPGVRFIEYEALQADLPAAMAELDAWLGLGRGPARARELAALCTFERMKARQEKYDHATDKRAGRGRADGRFIRQGRAGSHREVMSDAQLSCFEAAARRHWRRPGVELNLPAFLH